MCGNPIDAVVDAAKDVGHAVSDAASTVVNTVEDVGFGVAEGVADVGSGVVHGAEDLGAGVAQGAEDWAPACTMASARSSRQRNHWPGPDRQRRHRRGRLRG